MVSTNPIYFFEEAIESTSISEERKELLSKIAKAIVAELNENNQVSLNFICTHNSRRSQFSQVWSHVAVDYFGLKNIVTNSSGTEVTAFNRNTVCALRDVGFDFKITEFSHQNPQYAIYFSEAKKPIIGFSKTFDSESIQQPYFAITTCNHADENCPFIPEAKQRFHLPFVDPKKYDETPQRAEEYTKTSKIIASEMAYLFGEVASSL